jgi:hypothetical protein
VLHRDGYVERLYHHEWRVRLTDKAIDLLATREQLDGT